MWEIFFAAIGKAIAAEWYHRRLMRKKLLSGSGSGGRRQQ